MTADEIDTKLLDIARRRSDGGITWTMRESFALGQASMQPRPDLDSLITENAANRAIIEKQAAELAALRVENERLTAGLVLSNAEFEKYERLWYLRGDELAALREQVRWRPVTEIPIEGRWYLCADFEGEKQYHRCDVFFWKHNGGGWMLPENDYVFPSQRWTVTHWMPLPAPDAKEEK